MRAATILVVVAALTGCGVTQRVGDFVSSGAGLGSSTVRTDLTVPFKAVLRASRDDPRAFVVSTNETAVPLDDLRESIRYPATRYCIETFGGSDVDWALAGDDWASVLENAALIFSGRCTAR